MLDSGDFSDSELASYLDGQEYQWGQIYQNDKGNEIMCGDVRRRKTKSVKKVCFVVVVVVFFFCVFFFLGGGRDI